MAKDNKDISKGLAIVLLIVILLVSESVIYYNATQKYGFHIDELLSFGHSNSSNGAYLFPIKVSGLVIDENDSLYNHWIDPIVFWDYLTVQESEVFNYSEIKNNLSDSVHPPLYYFILHTVCSFFPETFSKWLGIIPNMALFSLVLVFLFKLSWLTLGSRRKSLLVCAVYGFSIEAVNTTIFIRSYLLLTLITLLLVLETIKFLLDSELNITRLITIFIFAMLGLLTHYYFYIFLVIFSILVFIYLLLNNKTRMLYSFMGIVGFAILISFFLSPNVLRHLFFSTRGLEAIFRALVGLLTLGCLTAIALLVYRIIRKNNKSRELPTIPETFNKVKNDLGTKLSQSPNNDLLFILLFITIIMVAIVIKMVAPGMDVHSDRYYFNLFPLLCLTGITLIFSLGNRYKLGEKAPLIISSILLILSISSNLFLRSAYLFPVSENRELLNNEIEDSICLLVLFEDSKILTFSDVLYNSNTILAAREIAAISIEKAFSEIESAKKITIIIDSRIPQTSEELTILEDQIGYPLQYLYEARHGILLYRVYSLSDN